MNRYIASGGSIETGFPFRNRNLSALNRDEIRPENVPREIYRGESKYTFISQLGQGGFSKVYHYGNSQKDEKGIVLKIQTRGEDEAEILQYLSRNDRKKCGVVSSRGLWINNRRLPGYYVMPKLDPLPWPDFEEQAITYFYKVKGYIECLKQKGHYYADLKRENILIDHETGELYLGDVGSLIPTRHGRVDHYGSPVVTFPHPAYCIYDKENKIVGQAVQNDTTINWVLGVLGLSLIPATRKDFLQLQKKYAFTITVEQIRGYINKIENLAFRRELANLFGITSRNDDEYIYRISSDDPNSVSLTVRDIVHRARLPYDFDTNYETDVVAAYKVKNGVVDPRKNSFLDNSINMMRGLYESDPLKDPHRCFFSRLGIDYIPKNIFEVRRWIKIINAYSLPEKMCCSEKDSVRLCNMMKVLSESGIKELDIQFVLSLIFLHSYKVEDDIVLSSNRFGEYQQILGRIRNYSPKKVTIHMLNEEIDWHDIVQNIYYQLRNTPTPKRRKFDTPIYKEIADNELKNFTETVYEGQIHKNLSNLLNQSSKDEIEKKMQSIDVGALGKGLPYDIVNFLGAYIHHNNGVLQQINNFIPRVLYGHIAIKLCQSQNIAPPKYKTKEMSFFPTAVNLAKRLEELSKDTIKSLENAYKAEINESATWLFRGQKEDTLRPVADLSTQIPVDVESSNILNKAKDILIADLKKMQLQSEHYIQMHKAFIHRFGDSSKDAFKIVFESNENDAVVHTLRPSALSNAYNYKYLTSPQTSTLQWRGSLNNYIGVYRNEATDYSILTLKIKIVCLTNDSCPRENKVPKMDERRFVDNVKRGLPVLTTHTSCLPEGCRDVNVAGVSFFHDSYILSFIEKGTSFLHLVLKLSHNGTTWLTYYRDL